MLYAIQLAQSSPRVVQQPREACPASRSTINRFQWRHVLTRLVSKPHQRGLSGLWVVWEDNYFHIIKAVNWFLDARGCCLHMSLISWQLQGSPFSCLYPPTKVDFAISRNSTKLKLNFDYFVRLNTKRSFGEIKTSASDIKHINMTITTKKDSKGFHMIPSFVSPMFRR